VRTPQMKINAKRFVGCIWITFIVLFLMISLPGHLNQKRSIWTQGAKRTLRAYGEAQLSYRETNLENGYGSWNALDRTGYIEDSYTQGNMIENYSLFTSVPNPRSNSWSLTFTAVAFPRKTTPPGYILTFAIREDQILRAYNPDIPDVNFWGKDDDFGAITWEPIK
jgi:hypothetical protein